MTLCGCGHHVENMHDDVRCTAYECPCQKVHEAWVTTTPKQDDGNILPVWYVGNREATASDFCFHGNLVCDSAH